LLDVREPGEFEQLHIPGSLNVPRGVLEQSSESGFEESNEELINARENRTIVVICRSGYRSALAANVLQILGFQQVLSMKTGIKGWNDYELPLTNAQGAAVSSEQADTLLTAGPAV
jgi:rhodanese-related sulfurtransferase